MPQIKGTNVVAPVVPLDTADVHPSHEARYGKGGYRTAATLAERDAIPAPRREAGMLVYVQADDKIYQLSADLLAWDEFSGGVSSWTELEGKPSTFPPEPHGHTVSAIVGLQAALDGKQAAGSYAASVHNHTAAQITDFAAAVVAAAPPTTNASLLTSGTLPDARLSSNIARTSDITTAVANVVNAAPAALDTLNELAAALGNDASFSVTVTNALAAKAPLASPTFTGTVSGVTKAMVGLGNVDNTSDASKPISTATQTALDGKAALVHTHTVSAITDAGTAATRNVPATGNAATTEVVLGSDTRLTDSRTPTSHTHGFLTNAGNLNDGANAAATNRIAMTNNSGQLVAATLGIGLGVINNVPNTIAVTYGTSVNTACQGNDARLSDARTPTAHKSSHATGGSDALTPADIGAATQSHTHSAQDVSGLAAVATSGAYSDLTGRPTLGTAAAAATTDFAAASHSHAASAITSGTLDVARIPSLPASQIGSGVLATARLGTGTASASNYLRGDGAWVAAPVTSVNGQTGAVTVAASAKKFWWM